ncbi:MAG: tetratricopeptide repeat protein, partial [Thermodesulfobacteriota bacterium]
MNAVEQYKKALSIDPLFVPAYDGLGKVYFRMGFRDEADREFAIADGLEKLKEDPGDLEAAVKMGWAMMNKNLHRHVVALLDPILKLNPRHPDLLKIMGLSYKSLGNDKAARQLLKTGVERWPKDPDFYQHLGGLEIKSGNREEGERLNNISRLISKIQADPMDMESRVELARLFMARNLYNEAAEYLRQAVSLDKEKSDYWYVLGECYQKAGLMPAAVDALKQAAKYAPVDPKPHKLISRLYQ